MIRGNSDQRKHNGGAWKVAYADFVTALMALFIVLWMMNSSKPVKDSVAGYFRDPKGYTKRLGAGPANAGEGIALNRSGLGQIRERIEEALRSMPDFAALREHVRVSVTGEGVRVDLLEDEQGMFFVTGSPNPTEAGNRLLRVLAAQLSRMGNHVAIEGHTDARPFRNEGPQSRYGNWELSVDRANAARRLLIAYGMASEQIVEVRGFAAEQLMNAADPNDPRNRRVSVVVKL